MGCQAQASFAGMAGDACRSALDPPFSGQGAAQPSEHQPQRSESGKRLDLRLVLLRNRVCYNRASPFAVAITLHCTAVHISHTTPTAAERERVLAKMSNVYREEIAAQNAAPAYSES